MNPIRRPFSSSATSQPTSLAFLVALLALFGMTQRSSATVNEDVWKAKYGVSSAQMADSAWRTTKDDDIDGNNNGVELVLGTNPFVANGAASVLKVTTVVVDATNASVTFPTVVDKQYVMQKSLAPTSGWTNVSGALVSGDGSPKTLVALRSLNPGPFYRVLVQDLDADADGLSDWAEKVTGYNPNDPSTDGSVADSVALPAALTQLSAPPAVTVAVTKSTATQPMSGAPIDTGSVKIIRGGLVRLGTLVAPAISVPLLRSGTAVEGTDYDALVSPAVFPIGVTEVVRAVNPKANASRKTNVTAIIVAQGGAGYTVGSPASGGVVINPAGVTNGTGLTGNYHNASSSTYSPNQTDIFLGSPELTRVDATIDFYGIASISTGNPCTITTTSAHGLVAGTPVTIQGVVGGSFSVAINGRHVATPHVSNPNIFTVASNCTAFPTSLLTAAVCGVNGITGVSTTGNPTTITTRVPHGFGANGTTVPVAINWLNGTSAGINSTFTATVTGTSTFTIPFNNTTANAGNFGVAEISGPRGINGWGTTSGPIGMSSPATGGAWSVRWTGQVMPQFSETYTFDVRSSASAKLWVNGKLLVDRWAIGVTAGEFINSITLKAGTLYDIQIDYWQSAPAAGGTGFAEAHLYWWSPSQTKQIVPQTRLFPEPTLANKLTAITSSFAAVGYVTVPFTFNVTTPDIGVPAASTFSVAANSGALPPGLSLNTSTGAITGTPTTAGTYNVVVNASNNAAAPPGTVTGSSVIDFTIYPVGAVTREVLATTAGGKVSNIVIPQDNPQPTHDTIPAIDDDTNRDNNVGLRLRGYIVPPKTGNYYFWLWGSSAAELWISNDSQYVNRIRRVSLTAGSSTKKAWSTTAQSPWISLVAGQKYYFEVLQNSGNTGIADDHVAVGWCQDDVGTVPAVAGAANPTATTPLPPTGGGVLQGYPLSGTVPSYVFQAYDYPVLAPPTGTLYAGNMGPQTSAITSASGSANLQVNAAETQAILHFAYQNLTTPRTGYHLHVDSYTSSPALGSTVHPSAEIIFDIDDADAFPPELRTADGGYVWVFAPIGSFASAAQIVEAIKIGKVYLNVHSVAYPNGEIRGTFGLIDGSQTPPDASAYAEPATTDLASTDAGAARFLNHATFGASPADVTYVKANGFPAWITNQLTKPTSRTSGDVVANLTADINQPYPSTNFTNAWWKYAITGSDQLRQRLAFALSEIMVISWANNTGPLRDNGRILADYHDQLLDYCLPTTGITDSGTFRGLLKAVTLTPAMGLYLDMRANQKGDIQIGRSPNENYAREIMQLFSIGIFRMWDDGRFMLGADAGLIPTYTQAEIIGLSNLMTGWNYAQPNSAGGRLPTNFSPGQDPLNPMKLVPFEHELSRKLLLNNVVTPAATGQTPRVNITSIPISVSPCTVNTSTAHGLKTGDTVKIAGAVGTFVPAGGINASFVVTVTSPTAFTVPVQCTVAGGAAGTVTGATVIQPTYSISNIHPPITGSQADNTGAVANPPYEGYTHPYDQYGLKELDAAIDNIVNNDNVPPYICRQLIQRLVTSDPSPGYIYRVVQKFKDNGSGVRGDLAAVVKQILLDGEARSSSVTQNSLTFGKQREPMLRLTGPARAFTAASFSGNQPTFGYTQLTGINSHRLRILTSSAHDFSTNFPVSLNFRVNYTALPAGQTTDPYNNPTTTTYTVSGTTTISSTTTAISGVAPGSPCVVTTTQKHGLITNDTATISGVTGGTFEHPTLFVPVDINASRVITRIDDYSFSVLVNCTAVPTSVSNAILLSNPCKVTTATPHGMLDGNTVTISGVTGGTFTPTINGTYTVTYVDANSFTIPVNCQTPATSLASAQIVGGNMMEVPATGMVNVTYSQPAGSTTMTVNVAGPQTDASTFGGTPATIKSKVYLDMLTRSTIIGISSIAVDNPTVITTTVPHDMTGGEVVTISGVTGGTFGPPINGTFTVTVLNPTQFTVASNCTVAPTSVAGAAATGAFGALAADGVYSVQTNVGNTFTVTTADTPANGRSGNVLIPRITTSYSPSGTNVIYNTNVNHNLQVGNKIWVDVPVVGSPVPDAEYAVSVITDEDHFTTSRVPAPVPAHGGTYPFPSGSNNGITIWPLVAAPTGRSGNVLVDQSTFNLNSTETTLTQSPLNAPTVFNYFFPDYKFPGTLANSGLDSPEFQLTTDTNVTNLTNSLTNMIIGTGGGNGNPNGLSSFNNGSGQVVMSIEPYLDNARTANAGIPALVDDLANLLVGAPLETATRTEIINFAANNTNFPYTTPTNLEKRDRVRAIIHLIITSAEYAVQK